MEQPQTVSNRTTGEVGQGTHFIEANTEVLLLDDIRRQHIIPVFGRDNEPTISQTQFVEAVQEAVSITYDGEDILEPDIRVSHPIKGRVPEARNKAARDLLPDERTIYFERMVFKVDVPSITTRIDDEEVCLSIGGMKAYNLDNLGKDSRSPQHFTVFIGFKNTVCSNMCIWSDGSVANVSVTSLKDLIWQVEKLIVEFRFLQVLEQMKRWAEIGITESQFVHILGRARYFNTMPRHLKDQIYPLEISDSQMHAIAKGYHRAFRPGQSEYLSLWQFFNLATAAVKSSYIDRYVDRCANASGFVQHIDAALEGEKDSWYLS